MQIAVENEPSARDEEIVNSDFLSSKPSGRLQELALFGGSPVIDTPVVDKWRKIRFRDAVRVAKRMFEDRITHPGACYEVKQFEADFARLTQTKFALMVNSGTASLHSAYFALGIGPGDEVIVPSYTFFASVSPILQCGATPVFCDIDPHTLTASPEDVEARITSRTKAICLVHVWGNPARLDALSKLAEAHDLAVIEDCSHAHGATYDGRPVGSWGAVGCFSLQGNKAVSGGEAGVAVTNDPEVYDRMLALAHYGRTANEQAAHTVPVGGYSLGLKYRPHLYSVILAQGSLNRLPRLNELRRANLSRLTRALEDCQALIPVGSYTKSERGGFLEFLFRYDKSEAGGWSRGAFVKAAQAEGVPLSVDRYVPLHKEHMFSNFVAQDLGGAFRHCQWPHCEPLEQTDRVCSELVSLPAFTQLKPDLVDRCALALKKVTEISQSTRS